MPLFFAIFWDQPNHCHKSQTYIVSKHPTLYCMCNVCTSTLVTVTQQNFLNLCAGMWSSSEYGRGSDISQIYKQSGQDLLYHWEQLHIWFLRICLFPSVLPVPPLLTTSLVLLPLHRVGCLTFNFSLFHSFQTRFPFFYLDPRAEVIPFFSPPPHSPSSAIVFLSPSDL